MEVAERATLRNIHLMSKGSRSTKPGRAVPPTATELERAWSTLSADITSAAYREKQPTPQDENPLRHDNTQSEQLEKQRDKLPTLPEADPLRYDAGLEKPSAPPKR